MSKEIIVELVKPILYYNGSEDDIAALILFQEREIDCDFGGPLLGHPTPHVVWGYRDYVGLGAIQKFVVDYDKARKRLEDAA